MPHIKKVESNKLSRISLLSIYSIAGFWKGENEKHFFPGGLGEISHRDFENEAIG